MEKKIEIKKRINTPAKEGEWGREKPNERIRGVKQCAFLTIQVMIHSVRSSLCLYQIMRLSSEHR